MVVDVIFPIDMLTAAVAEFQSEFPDTPLRLYVEALGAVLKPVIDGRCAFGIMGSLPTAPSQMTTERLLGVRMRMVASPLHPLANYAGSIPTAVLARHTQLVLTDRSELSRGREFGVVSSKTWRLADLDAKHAFLRAGLGWGGMPFDVIAADLISGALVSLRLEEAAPKAYTMTMSAVFPAAAVPGPAGRWLIDRLKLEYRSAE